MDQRDIVQYLADTFTGLDLLQPTDGPGAGDTFIYYDPQRDLDPARRMPFATIVTKDYGEFDNTSKLNRPDVFRLNIGVSRETFIALFGPPPSDESAYSAYDFAALDRVMPHPVYGRQSWVCVLSPSAETFESVIPLLAEAYAIVAKRYASRQAQS